MRLVPGPVSPDPDVGPFENVVVMSDEATPETWVSEYAYPNRRVSLTLATAGAVGSHWSGIRRNESLSDPVGALVASHPDFDESTIGSLTIWPFKVAGEGSASTIGLWWTAGPVFRDPPRAWADAIAAANNLSHGR